MSVKEERDNLLSAILDIRNISHDWLSHRWNKKNPGYRDNLKESDWPKHYQLQRSAIIRIRELVNAGVDRWISPVLGTPMGRWTTELLTVLTEVEPNLWVSNPKEDVSNLPAGHFDRIARDFPGKTAEDRRREYQEHRQQVENVLSQCSVKLSKMAFQLNDLDISGFDERSGASVSSPSKNLENTFNMNGRTVSVDNIISLENWSDRVGRISPDDGNTMNFYIPDADADDALVRLHPDHPQFVADIRKSVEECATARHWVDNLGLMSNFVEKCKVLGRRLGIIVGALKKANTSRQEKLSPHPELLPAPVSPNKSSPTEGDLLPFVPSPLQTSIMEKLNGRAMRTRPLAAALHIDQPRLYKPDGIKQLRALGKLKYHPRLGFYRPDKLPPQLKQTQ